MRTISLAVLCLVLASPAMADGYTVGKIEIKEIRLRPKTNMAHRDFKVDDARRWLEHNMKVRVTIRFRGREITYPEIALEDLREIAQSLAEVAVIEQPPAIEGRAMSMMLVPATKGAKKKGKDGSDDSPEKNESPREQVPAKS